jgi:hypothetical protein
MLGGSSTSRVPAGVLVRPFLLLGRRDWPPGGAAGRSMTCAAWTPLLNTFPTDLFQRSLDSDVPALVVVLVRLLPDQLTPPSTGVGVHQTEHEATQSD